MANGFNRCRKRGGHIRRVEGPDSAHGIKRYEFVEYCHKCGNTYRGRVRSSFERIKRPGPPTLLSGIVVATPEENRLAKV